MANTHSIGFLDADNSYLSRADHANYELTGTNDRTYEAWVKINTLKSGGGLFVRWSNEGGSNKNFLCRMETGGVVKAWVGSGSSTGASVAGTTDIDDGDWHHVAITWSGSTDDKIRIYIDGTLDATMSGTGAPTAASTSLVIGGKSGLSGEDSDIEMDDVRIWDTQRSVSEIDDNKDAELAGTESGLLDYWKLNNDLTNSVSGGGSGSLTNNNSATFSTDIPDWGGSPPAATAFSQAVVIM